MSTSLDDLPLELVACIADALVRPHDVARWQACSSRFKSAYSIDRTVAAYLGHDRHRGKRLLVSGAPLHVVQAVFARWGETPVRDWLYDAVMGGRCDVVRWMVDVVVAAGRAEHADPSKTWADAELRSAARDCFDCASMYGNHDIMRFLRSLFGTDDTDVSLGETQIRRAGQSAAYRGDLATFALTHDMLAGAAPERPRCLVWDSGCVCKEARVPNDTVRTCGCSQNAARLALLSGRVNIVEWMRGVGCCGYPRQGACSKALAYAVDCCPPETFWYLARTKPPPSREAFALVIDKAAAKGRVDVVARLHQEGMAQCRIDTLIAAAKNDRVAVLKWASGQGDTSGLDSSPTTVDNNVRAPIDAWRPTLLAWHAARHGSIKAIKWLLARPDARLCVTIGSVEAALLHSNIDVALAVHHSGVVRFDQWSALDAAVATGSVSIVETVADHGGACTVSTFVAAIKRACEPWDVGPFGYLCARYGTALVQDAVDRIEPHLLEPRVANLLRARVPSVRLPQDPL
nr:ankyrin repeat [Pandoravirus massiliensis]